ncbi:MAG: sigma-E processing peptidase SpoIIGA [Clostridia bacterium]|nr:sigma-E processing peptidase SpoIIGA [Clostridia bacterium]
MTIAGEWFLCANLLLDAACLHAVGRIGGKAVRAERIILAALWGTVSAMLSLMYWGIQASVYVSLPIAASMTLGAFGLRNAPKGTARLAVLGIFSSGAAHILHDLGLSAPGIVLCLLPAIDFAFHTLRSARHEQRGEAEIRLLFDTGGVSLCGIWDTGNMLRDPVTSLPVIVVSYRALKPYLPGGVDPARYETLPHGFRLISVQTAAGAKLLMCFRPRAIYIRFGRIWRAFHAVVAVSASLPENRALLPPTLEA